MYDHILVAQAPSLSLTPKTRNNMFHFRTEMFHARLGWNVPLREGLDMDIYDDLDPVYFNSLNGDRQIEGSARLLPTTGPYMLPELFPQLLRGEAAPQDPAIWELSRFAVIPSDAANQGQLPVHPVTSGMLQCLADYARQHGISQFVIVTTTALERLLIRMGLSMYRFGDGKPTRIGRTLCVAVWINIDTRTFAALGLTQGHMSFSCEAA